VLDVVLQARCLALRRAERPQPHAGSRSTTTGAGRSRRQEGTLATPMGTPGSSEQLEPRLAVAVAYQAATKALPGGGSVAALRELFTLLSRSAEIDGLDNRRGALREFNVLLLLLHDALQQGTAPMMRELIHRAEQRNAVTAEDFREALRDARLLGIDENVWRPKLSAGAAPAAQISGELMLDYLGGGSPARAPRAVVTESSFMAAVTDAMAADYAERIRPLQRLWERQAKNAPGSLSYSDFKSVLHSAEPSLPAPMVRALFLSAVETSRSCSQLEGGLCPPLGTLEPSACGQYGGDVVTFRLVLLAAMRCRLFLRDAHLATPALDGRRSAETGRAAAGPPASAPEHRSGGQRASRSWAPERGDAASARRLAAGVGRRNPRPS